jgi:hypothetical protein
MKNKDKTKNIEADEHKYKTINITVDYSKPVLGLLASAVDDFLKQLLDECPRSYYVKVEIGNDHPEVVSIPMEKTFRGNGELLDYSEVREED